MNKKKRSLTRSENNFNICQTSAIHVLEHRRLLIAGIEFSDNLCLRSSSLTIAKWHSVAWPDTMTTLRRLDFLPIPDLFTELDLLPTYENFL